MDGHISWGQLSLQGTFFKNISIHFLEAFRFPFEKKNILNKATRMRFFFVFSPMCGQFFHDRRRFRSWSNRKGTLCDFLATAISFSMPVDGRQDEN